MFIKIIGAVYDAVYEAIEEADALGSAINRLTAPSDETLVRHWTCNGYYVVYETVTEDYRAPNGKEICEEWDEIITICDSYEEAEEAKISFLLCRK